MSVHSRRMVHYLILCYRVLITVMDIVLVAVIGLLTATTIYGIARDLIDLYLGVKGVEPTIILSNAFLLIVYTEIIRSMVIARRRPEMYLIGIAEAGFVLSVKEIITSIVVGALDKLVMPTISALALAIVLLILYKYVLPMQRIKRTSILRRKRSAKTVRQE